MEDGNNNAVVRKISVSKIDIEDIKKASPYVIMSPRSMLQKQTSGKANCLCSPTTHVGSFRCRLHRNTLLLGRHTGSVGSNLSELAAAVKSSSSSSSPAAAAPTHRQPFK